MEIFLKEVANQIFSECSGDLSGQRLVFPNRRSSLYFKSYLAKYVERPILAPDILTINELFQERSKLALADPLFLIFRLYESYKAVNTRAELFDEFYFWGEMLINDFDDIDKYIVDHSLLFQNLKDLRDIDDKFGGLEPEVIEIIKQFWRSFDPANITPEKSDFLAVWDILAKLYETFRDSLRSSGLAYEGMLMRDVILDIKEGTNQSCDDNNYYHFIGFNALNRCEKELLSYLKRQRCAMFYWDYDNYYIVEENHEAGFFLRDNLKDYGQDLKGGIRYDNLIRQNQPPDKWQVYKAPSDVAQAKLIPGLLEDFGDIGSDPDKTAIVLADEKMLMPVLNSVPGTVRSINVTMGYPLYQTPVYSLVSQLMSLQKNGRKEGDGYSFYYVDVLKILNHQYITFRFGERCDKLKKTITDQNLIRVSDKELMGEDFFNRLFTGTDSHIGVHSYLIDIFQEILTGFASEPGENHEEIIDTHSETGYKLQQEYLFLLIKTLKQLDSVFNKSDIVPGLDIYFRIVDKLLRQLIVPFSGEPLAGLQVMGILETRALDFENIVFLSVNEGVLPRNSAGNSYIPYNLRMAFELPTIKHQDSIYAYYFYRLAQRAKRVKFVYNSSASGIRTGEMSRFLLQLKFNKRLSARFIDTRFNIVPPPVNGELMIRDSAAQNILADKYLSGDDSRPLSPSALNTWINCRMRFYYSYIVGLKEVENVKEEVDSLLFGNILHEAMNILYSGYSGMEISAGQIGDIQNSRSEIERVVLESYRKNFSHRKDVALTGKNLIITSVIKDMVGRILEIDKLRAPFTIIDLEGKYSRKISFESNGLKMDISIGGTIDRIDRVGDTVRILDYKSGKDTLDIESPDKLIEYNVRNRNSAAFQTFIYSLIYSELDPGVKLRPALYPVRVIYSDDFSDIFKIKRGEYSGDILDFRLLADSFEENLKVILSDIFDSSRPFDMTTVKDNCKYCPFSRLCGRHDLT